MLQSKAHIIIIDGEVKSTSLFSILSFPVIVRNLAPKRFAILDGKLLELVKVGPSTPSSWFIDQIVRSDGSIVVASSFDPLFLLLPALEACASHFSPLGQILESFGSSTSMQFSSPLSTSTSRNMSTIATSSIVGADLRPLWEVNGLYEIAEKICDVREGFIEGDENSLLRLNKEKVLSVLSAKVTKLAHALQQRAEAAEFKSRQTLGSFSTVSKVLVKEDESTETTSSSSSSSSSLSSPSPPSSLNFETALSLVGEYISDAWIIQVSQTLNIPLNSIAPHLVVKAISSSYSSITSSNSISSSTSPDGNVISTNTSLTESSSTVTPAIGRWNQVAMNDPLSELERFTHQKKGGFGSSSSSDPSSSHLTTSGKLKAGTGGQSQANKKLASSQVKGLRSVASFFTTTVTKDKNTTT